VRDFLHVADVANAFATLVASDVEGPVNVGSGERVTIADVVGKVAELTGRPELIEFGAISVPADEPPMLVADIRRLREEVGWRPRRTLEEGLAETVEWLRRTPR